MERMLVVVFDSEANAYEASRVLQTLDEDGMIAVYADAVATKNREGAVSIVRTHRGLPQATMGGTAVGSLIGALGGPVGLAIGVAGGAAIGAATDFARSRIDSDFARDAANALLPGRSALVAEIDEEVTSLVDERMEALGGSVFRRALLDVADATYDREIAAIEADLAQADAEHAASSVARKAKLQDRIDRLKEKLTQARDRARAKRQAIHADAEAKIEHLNARAAGAREDVKARQAERIRALRTRYKEWFDEVGSRVI